MKRKWEEDTHADIANEGGSTEGAATHLPTRLHLQMERERETLIAMITARDRYNVESSNSP